MEHNVSAPTQKRLLERMAINPRFPVRALPQFHRELKRQAAEILWRFDADMRREELRFQREPVTRLCIGLYAFEDPVITGNGRGASRRGSTKRRRKQRSPGRRR